MKKIIIAAVAIATAGIVNAASFTWATANYNKVADHDGVALTSATDYTSLMNGGNIVLVLLSEGTYSGAMSVLTGTTGDTATYKASGGATIKGGLSTTFGFTYDSGILKNGDKIGVMYQDKSGALSQLVYIDSTGTVGDAIDSVYTISGLTDDSWQGDKFTFTTAGTSASPVLLTTAVPEPTSGLLLLLGMAGLALKRKVA